MRMFGKEIKLYDKLDIEIILAIGWTILVLSAFLRIMFLILSLFLGE